MSATDRTIEHVQPSELEGAPEQGERVWSDSLDVVKDMQVKIEVCLGEAHLSVADLMDLREKSVIKLDRDAAAPVDLLLDGKVIGRGNLVVVGDHYGIQLTEIDKR
jgi:flagellar motor switch protein FliN/FliY